MTYIYQYDVAAVLLTAALLLLIVTRREYPSLRRRYFLGIVISNGVACILDVGAAHCLDYGIPLWITVFLNAAYMVVHAFTAMLFVLYAYETGEDDERSALVPVLISMSFLLVALLCATSHFTHIVFFIDESGYERGSLHPLLYFYSFASLLIGCVYLLKGERDFSNSKTPSILVSAVIILCVLVAQAINPRLLLEGFGISVMTLQVYYFAEVGSAFMLQGTYCFNRVAFRDCVDKRMKRQEEFCIIGVAFMDASISKDTMNLELPQKLANTLATSLHKELGQKNVFYLRDSCFAVISTAQKQEEAIEHITHAVKEEITIDDAQILLEPHFCALDHPGLVFTASQAESAVLYALGFKRDSHHAQQLAKVDKSMLVRQRREAQVEAALRKSLAEDSLVLHFQPIRTLESGKYESAEVLVRLWDKELGMIYPGEFVPFAEETGLVNKLGDQVLRKACAFYKKNDLERRGVKFLEVNLSAVQLQRDDLPEHILGIIEDEGIKPQNVNLEITETAVVKDIVQAQRHMEAMCAQGITFSLDDYGVGASSARNVYRLPLSVVKLDMSIVQDAMKDEQARTLLKHMTSMLKDFDKIILAEGVETPETVAMLESMGVTHIQGYLYSRPLSSLSYLEFLGVEHGAACADGKL